MSEARDNNLESLLTITLKQQKIIEQLESEKAELINTVTDLEMEETKLRTEKAELIESVKEIQSLTVKGIPFENMRHFIQKQCYKLLKKHGVEI